MSEALAPKVECVSQVDGTWDGEITLFCMVHGEVPWGPKAQPSIDDLIEAWNEHLRDVEAS